MFFPAELCQSIGLLADFVPVVYVVSCFSPASVFACSPSISVLLRVWLDIMHVMLTSTAYEASLGHWAYADHFLCLSMVR